MAPYLEDITAARWLRITAFVLSLAGGLVIVAAGIWALLGHSTAAQGFLQRRELEDLGHMVWGMILVIGAVFVAAALWFRPRRGVHALLAGIVGLWMTWSLWAYPLLNDSSSSAGVMRHARELAGADTEIGMVAWKEQNLLMAVGPVREFGFKAPWDKQYVEAVQWLQQAPAKRRIFILDQAMEIADNCIDKSKAVRVGHANRREWWLLGGEAVKPDCVPAGKLEPEAGEEGDP